MEELVKQLGFKGETEFHHMVAAVDISTSENLQAFKDWQNNDGTKEGISKLPVR
jgi:hypothetical protein